MASIQNIGIALPSFEHRQEDILAFMQEAWQLPEKERRMLAYLYHKSDIEKRYSVLNDFAVTNDRKILFGNCQQQDPSLEKRMEQYHAHAASLSLASIKDCLGEMPATEITHLVTVSCTGMSAPGLDLQLMQAMQLPPHTFRTSVNFMGCYAAIHGLKLAKMICDGDSSAKVMVVATELCTLHFQQEYTPDNAASSLLFADGSAAALVTSKPGDNSLVLEGFFSHVDDSGASEMTWDLGSNGFLMKLSGYVPDLIGKDIEGLVAYAYRHYGITQSDLTHWCVHPGGKRILDTIERKLNLQPDDLCQSRRVLAAYGNMSSPTILFVLHQMMQAGVAKGANILGIAFGPGLTMETVLLQAS